MYTDVKLEKGMYSITGKSFTEALTELDPDSEYKGTDLEQLDAFERQLKRFDIKVSGEGCDRVEKFFLSTESAVLFPEYVRRQIKAGMDEVSLLPYITAAQGYTDSYDYRALTVTDSGNTAGTAQNTAIAATTVALGSTATALTKYARKLSCSYESVRKQRLEAFGVILRSLGANISRAINSSAAGVLKDYANSTASTYTGSITYAALASFWASMSQYDMDVMLCSPAMMANILALDEMKYCVTDFMSSGRVVTPYGVTLIKCPSLASDVVVGIDSKCAAEVIYGTDVVVDIDKLISTQSDEVAASILCGVSVLTGGAVKVLKKTT
ncbi:MAG: hypothetical protein IJ723_03545 [Ruminococcus sp.]|nr:hypothetical protein [Ruminococcus sp.]